MLNTQKFCPIFTKRNYIFFYFFELKVNVNSLTENNFNKQMILQQK